MNCERCGRHQRAMHDLSDQGGGLICCRCYGGCESANWWDYGQCPEVRDADHLARNLQLGEFLPAPESRSDAETD